MKSLRRLTPFFRPYRWIIILLFFTVALPVAMELVVPRILAYIIDEGIWAGNISVIIQGAVLMLLTALVGAAATLGQGICRARLSQGFAFDLRNDLFAHVQSFSFGNMNRMHTGQIMTRLSSDVDIVRMFTSHGVSLLLRAVLMISGSLVMLLIIDWQLAMVVVALLPIAALIIWWVIRTAQPLFLIVQQRLAALNTTVQENLAGTEVVKAFVRERYEIGRFGKDNIEYRDQHIRVGRLLAVSLPVLTTLTNLGMVAVIWFGGLSVMGDRLSVGELVAFTSYLMIGMAPLLLLSNMLTMVSQAEASSQRVVEVLDMQPLVDQPTDARIGALLGSVSFRHVSFHYDGDGGNEVLEDISFEVKPGQQVALLGATGSGKSTLVNLIPRFYDVSDGRILIDDVDIREWSLEDLRSQIGTVLQQTTLFGGSIRDNIAFGIPDASLDDVIEAARAAQAHAFVMAMPDGYDSVVEARGANLSGGQRQRIAIARALLVSPRVLILDDSTSAVDLATEFRLQQALDNLASERTTFVVAQRISSVLNADQILVLDRGKICAQGNHHQLLETSPIYREIYDSQLGGNGQG